MVVRRAVMHRNTSTGPTITSLPLRYVTCNTNFCFGIYNFQETQLCRDPGYITEVNLLRYQEYIAPLPTARHPEKPDPPHFCQRRLISRRHDPDPVRLGQRMQSEYPVLVRVGSKERWIARGIVLDSRPGDRGARRRIPHSPPDLPGGNRPVKRTGSPELHRRAGPPEGEVHARHQSGEDQPEPDALPHKLL